MFGGRHEAKGKKNTEKTSATKNKNNNKKR
jgi:hypothetical protein